MVELYSRLDYLNHYLGIGRDRVAEYIKQGRSEQLCRIASKLYNRHHKKRMREEEEEQKVQTQTTPKWWEKPLSEALVTCNCQGADTMFPEDGLIAVGFGYAALTKDGETVFQEESDDRELMTGADAESLAAADPDHDWRIHLVGPLRERNFQRQGEKNWVLYEQGQGFA